MLSNYLTKNVTTVANSLMTQYVIPHWHTILQKKEKFYRSLIDQHLSMYVFMKT